MKIRLRWYYILAGALVFYWGRAVDQFSLWPQMIFGLLVFVAFFALLDLQNWKDDERERRQ